MTERGSTDNSVSGTDNSGTIVQVHHLNGSLVLPGSVPRTSPGSPVHPWVTQIQRSQLWQRVPEEQDREAFLSAALVLVDALGALHAEAELTLADNDPWWDDKLATRFHGHISRLARAGQWELDGVEALLLVLAPFLSQCLWARTAARRSHVGPADLERRRVPGERSDFEEFFHREHERLVRRARLRLPARGAAEREIGWWLFHQWVDGELRGAERHSWEYKDLVAQLPLGDPTLIAVDAERVLLGKRLAEQMLYGLRLPLGELCRPERLENIRTVDSPGGGGQVRHEVHARRLGLLLAVARARALDLPALPDVLVENLGIPHRVELDELRATLDEADWEGDTGTTVLSAECHHEAVFEALLQHTNQIDALLDDIRRAVRDGDTREPLRALPVRALAEGLKPALGDDLQPKFESYSKFQVDPQRVQNLLMGDQLYRSPGLAVRELYQNALDACRYRRARTEYQTRLARKKGVVRGDTWVGTIRFTQSAEDGRAYLQCEDNGVGMSETDLARVFARAGTRFTDLTDVRNERAKWSAESVHLHPVSRFGIGVLSYFMIADEIEVTTRKLLQDGSTGPCYTASIYGPNHLFRIVPSDNGRTEAGTTVRLYLRDNAPSCVRELTRLLGIADFETSAEFEGRGPAVPWKAGVFRPRQRSSWDGADSIFADGLFVECLRTEDSGIPQVVWCEQGGGVLVDGILTRPSQSTGLLAVSTRGAHDPRGSDGGVGLFGAVVNLTGELVPKLSIDRLEILEDVSAKAGDLLRSAADELVASDSDLLSFNWIARVAQTSPGVADIVTRAAMAAGRELRLNDGSTFQVAEAGCFPQDEELMEWVRGAEGGTTVPDHILLWRLLLHGEAEQFADLVPELGDVTDLLPALPSDYDILSGWDGAGGDVAPGHVLWVASKTGVTSYAVAQRAARLGAGALRGDRFPDTTPDPLDLALLSRQHDGFSDWLPTDEPVPLGHFLGACLRHDIGTAEVAMRMERYGFDVSAAAKLPDRPSDEEFRLLSIDGSGMGRWLSFDRPVPPGRVLHESARLGIPADEVRRRLRDFGLAVEQAPPRTGPNDMKLLSRSCDGMPHWLEAGEAIPVSHVWWAAKKLNLPVDETTSILESYGMAVPVMPVRESSARERALFDFYTANMPYMLGNKKGIHGRYLWAWAGELDMSLRQVADGLRGLGMDVVFDFPEAPDHLDTALLSDRLDIWSRMSSDSRVSTVELLITADALRKGTAEIAARLSSYGLVLPEYDHPDRSGRQDDLKMLSHSLDGSGPRFRSGETARLNHLCAASRRFDITMEEAAARLRFLGIDVPDVKDMIRAAMAKLPRVEEA